MWYSPKNGRLVKWHNRRLQNVGRKFDSSIARLMNSFIFNSKEDTKNGFRVEIPQGIKDMAALLNVISVTLCFPGYFGGNWNALEECIRDLSWLPPGDIILSHKDVPFLKDPASLSIYLSILKGAVEKWNTTGSNLIFISPQKQDTTGEHALLVKRKFLVLFPPDTEKFVNSML